MTTSNQLLPCPFCGGPAKAAEAYIRGDQAFAHIHCENHCEVAPSAGASSALFYWSDLRKENVRIHSDDKAKLEATERAHAKWNRRATQPAAGEPVAWMRSSGNDVMTAKQKADCQQHNGLPGKRIAEHFSVPLYTAPPAAAHGDEAVRKRIRQLEVLLDRCRDHVSQSMELMDDYDDAEEDAGIAQELLDDIDAAMRAQGDGGSGDA